MSDRAAPLPLHAAILAGPGPRPMAPCHPYVCGQGIVPRRSRCPHHTDLGVDPTSEACRPSYLPGWRVPTQRPRECASQEARVSLKFPMAQRGGSVQPSFCVGSAPQKLFFVRCCA
jgi:hypothetical protein